MPEDTMFNAKALAQQAIDLTAHAGYSFDLQLRETLLSNITDFVQKAYDQGVHTLSVSDELEREQIEHRANLGW